MSVEIGELEYFLKRAKEFGADEAEIYISLSDEKAVKLEGRFLKTLVTRSTNVWVRVVVDKRIAISTSSTIEKSQLEKVIEEAVKTAKFSERDENWQGLPDPEKPKHSWTGYDEGIATLDTSYLVELLRDLRKTIETNDSTFKVTEGAVGAESYFTYIVNTNGIAVSQKGTEMSLYLSVKASTGGKDGVGSAFKFSRSLFTDYYDTADEAKQLALDEIKAEKLGETIHGEVVFAPQTIAMLLQNLLVPAFNAQHVLEGYSPLKDKMGQKILGELTIIDDGTIVGGMSTSLYDSEGIPRQRTVLVEKGVLKSYLHNNYTARRIGVKSTGNAGRSRGEVSVSRSNLVIAPGDYTEEEILAEAKILLKSFLLSVHTVNFVTGNFSVVASKPYLIKEGELKPIKPVTVAGNIYELADTIKTSNRLQQDFPGIFSPHVLFGKTTISG